MVATTSKNIVNWIDTLPRWLRYTLAVSMPFVALLFTLLLWSVVATTPTVFFFAAVALAAWIGGFAPGLAAVLTSTILLDYFFFTPSRAILSAPTDFVTLAIFGLVATLVSWTENQRRVVNLELRAARDELSTILNSVSDGITVQDAAGKVLFANHAISAMSGTASPTKLMSVPITSFYQRFEMRDENDQPMTSLDLPRVKVFEKGQANKLQFKVLDHELNQQYWREVTTTPIFDEQGNVRLVANVIRDVTAAKELERNIRAERRRLQLILDELGVFVGILNPDGTIIEVNRSAIRASGQEMSEIVGLPMYETYAWSKDAETQALIKDSVVRAAAGDSSQFDIQARAVGDIPIFVEYTIAPIRNVSGDIEFLIASAINITERKQNEVEMAELADLLESERERLARIVNTLPGVVFEGLGASETDAGGINFMSQYTETLLGYLPNRWLEDPAFGGTILHPDDLQSLSTNLLATYERGEKGIFECRIFAADGHMVYVEIRTTPYRDDTGQVTGLVGTMMDITARKTYEQQLEQLAALLDQERLRLTRILNTLPGIIFEAVGTPQNGNQKMVFVSDYAETLLGYPASHWLDDDMFGGSIVHPDDVAVTMKDATIIYESGEQGTLNYRVFAADQHIVHIEARTLPYRNVEGDIAGVVGVMMDVTLRKEAEHAMRKYAKELQRSNAELEQFAYVASHDLQEPLRMVGSYLQLLEQRYGDKLDADAHEFIAYAVDGANRMKKLIQDLLAYSRIQRSKAIFQNFALETALETAKDNLRLSIEETGATITSDTLPLIYGNITQLAQLFQNLIGNAIKFRRAAPPTVQIGVVDLDKCWEFSVRDNGIGIEDQYLERIFILFQRLHSRDTYTGTGIGLALCRKIVEQHEGRIWVESIVDEGSTFKFTIAKPDLLMREKILDGLD